MRVAAYESNTLHCLIGRHWDIILSSPHTYGTVGADMYSYYITLAQDPHSPMWERRRAVIKGILSMVERLVAVGGRAITTLP